MQLPTKYSCVCMALLVATIPANATLELLNFDDLPARSSSPFPLPGSGVITNGYGGLNWNTFTVINPATSGFTAFSAGVVSPNNVALAGNDSISAPAIFDLQSAYLTASSGIFTASRPLRVQVEGFLGTTMLYSNSYPVSGTVPTLFNFNFVGVDRVSFITSQFGPVTSPLQEFVMDNLTVNFPAPEPSTTALVTMGVVCAAVKTKRVRKIRRAR